MGKLKSSLIDIYFVSDGIFAIRIQAAPSTYPFLLSKLSDGTFSAISSPIVKISYNTWAILIYFKELQHLLEAK